MVLPPAGDRGARQALAFFLHPDDHALVRCCDGSDRYPPITAGAYLQLRFADSYGRD